MTIEVLNLNKETRSEIAVMINRESIRIFLEFGLWYKGRGVRVYIMRDK